MKFVNRKTPASEIEIKTDKDGHSYKSVKASYIKSLLMMVTGGNFTFEIKSREHISTSKEVIVEGRLVLNVNGRSASREQFGQHYLTTRTRTANEGKTTISYVSDIGNGYKAAATDALKKCASEFGFCWDIYGQEKIEVKEEKLPEVSHAEQKILDRLEHFLKEAVNEEELETYYETFLQTAEETPHSKALLKGYMNRILNNK
jgi:hypothetical protein